MDSLRIGMKLGKTLYGPNSEVYLKDHVILNSRYINRLKALGYNGIYIDDAISEGIEHNDIVDDKLRIETVHKVKSLYEQISVDDKVRERDWKSLEVLLNDILDEMLNKNNLVYSMIDLKQFDDYTFFHCVNVTFLTMATAIQMNLPRPRIYELSLASIMHDIGKVYIPHGIINKPGALTDEEFHIMKEHSLKGYQYLKESEYMSERACKGVLTHHERFDGLGYPYGETGDSINTIGKIIAVCDVYDAITSDRPYRKAWRPCEAIEYVMGNSSIRFEPVIVNAFLKKITPYPAGTIIKLSNGYTGIVVECNQDFVLRPKVRVFLEEGQKVNPYIVDMQSNRDYLNVTIIDVENY